MQMGEQEGAGLYSQEQRSGKPFQGVSAWDCLTPPTLPAWGRPANGGRKSLSLSPGACYLGSVSSLFQAGQTRPDAGPN